MKSLSNEITCMNAAVEKQSRVVISPERKLENNNGSLSLRYEKLPAIANITDSYCDIDDDADEDVSLDDDRHEMDNYSVLATMGAAEWEIMEDDGRDDGGDDIMDNEHYVGSDDDDDDLLMASKWKEVIIDEIAFQGNETHPGCNAGGKKNDLELRDLMSVALNEGVKMPSSIDEEAPTSHDIPSNGDTVGLWLPCHEINIKSCEKDDDEVSLLYDNPDIDDEDCLPQSTIDVLRFCLDDWAEDLVDCDVGVDSDSEVDEEKAVKAKTMKKKRSKKKKREEKKNRKMNWMLT